MRWHWTIQAHARVIAEGTAVDHRWATADDAAVELLVEWAAARGVAVTDLRGLVCAVTPPGGGLVGVADGRDW